jgi:dihydroflavonol-4-reductase
VLECAAQAGCSRIVYTSTVGCIGLPRRVNGSVVPTDEATPVSEAQMSNHYKRSKWRAEVVARELATKGFVTFVGIPVAIVLWIGTGIWVLYRIIRGWLALSSQKTLPT